MQEVGVSMIMLGTMYIYLSTLVFTDDEIPMPQVYDTIMKSVKEMMLEFEQDFFEDQKLLNQRLFNLGPKISSLIADYYEWQDIYRQMGLTLGNEADAPENHQ
jgi:hypothetical protein